MAAKHFPGRRTAVLASTGASIVLLVGQSNPAPAAPAALAARAQEERAATTSLPAQIVARDGRPGGIVGFEQGADQGEDQGEDIGQFATGNGDLGPTRVRARNRTRAGAARGGHGGAVTIVYNNHIYTACGTAGPYWFQVEPVVVQAGSGGRGGASGGNRTDSLGGQGSDQGEDQGEDIGQFAKGNIRIAPTRVRARNLNWAASTRGGAGGAVQVTFNTDTHCGLPPSEVSLDGVPATTSVDQAGNVSATFTTFTDCATGGSLADTPITIRAGSGGAGGSSGTGQGSDQGEDQGEDIGQYASGSPFGGPTVVHADNLLIAPPADGAPGAAVRVTFDNYLSCQTATTSSGTVSTASPVVVRAGDGGVGGVTGRGQGSDQAEDQGEDQGQVASGHARIGPTRVRARNRNFAANANGGRGGDVLVTYNDRTACGAAAPAVSIDERVTAHAGSGGAGGSSGRDQGADQHEDQGEDIGQYASGHASFGSVVVTANGRNRSRAANGAPGGDVQVTYHPAGCLSGSNPTAQLIESAYAVGGTGGNGGQTGWGQGLDQGEDQGEDIGQFASGHVRFGNIVVLARNVNVAGDATGGDGGDVTATVTAPSCEGAICATTADENVVGVAGNGGAGGDSGHRQGSDQGEDQGEDIGQYATGDVHAGSVSVLAINRNTSGDASGGDGGNVTVVAAWFTARMCSGSGTMRTLQPHVTATAGLGGAAGTSGRGQGAEHRQRVLSPAAPRSFAGERSISTRISTSTPGRARPGTNGATWTSGSCNSMMSALRPPARAEASAAEAAVVSRAPSFDVKVCHGTFGGSAFDLIVTRRCTLLATANIVHNVLVRRGGTLVARGGEILHDLLARRASGVSLHGVDVGHDLELSFLNGRSVPGGNSICGIEVGHNLAVVQATRRAGVISIGSGGPCAGNEVGHDVLVMKNSTTLVVKHNSVGHNAVCVFNRSLFAATNDAGHQNNCPVIFPG